MKTLDETIFEAPYTMTPWEENAIYYLKEYRDHMKNEIIELQEEVKKQKEMIEFLEKPLTWDELRTMEGKPVWVEYDNHLSGRKMIKYKVWDVIDWVTEDLILVKGDYSYKKDEFGDVWQAYRKERS